MLVKREELASLLALGLGAAESTESELTRADWDLFQRPRGDEAYRTRISLACRQIGFMLFSYFCWPMDVMSQVTYVLDDMS